MLSLNLVKLLYIFSAVVLIFFINFSMELDSSFFILGGRSEDASNAVFGRFSPLFISSLVLVSTFVFLVSLFLVSVKNIYFLMTLMMVNIFFCFEALLGFLIPRQVRIFQGHTFNEETDNWLKASNSDGILHYSISDLFLILILLTLVAALIYKKKYLSFK